MYTNYQIHVNLVRTGILSLIFFNNSQTLLWRGLISWISQVFQFLKVSHKRILFHVYIILFHLHYCFSVSHTFRSELVLNSAELALLFISLENGISLLTLENNWKNAQLFDFLLFITFTVSLFIIRDVILYLF